MTYKNQPITAAEAQQAIYLDFEGRGQNRDQIAPPSSVCGLLIEGEYQFYILDPKLKDLAEDKAYPYYSNLKPFLNFVYEKSQQENRRIVYWSSHERNVFRDEGFPIDEIGFDLKRPAKKHFKGDFQTFRKNAKKFRTPGLAKSTKKILRPQSFGLLTLIAGVIGLERPAAYGAGLVGKWVRLMQDQGVKKETYADWSKSGKTKASLLKKHNQHDCLTMQYVLEYLLNEYSGTLS